MEGFAIVDPATVEYVSSAGLGKVERRCKQVHQLFEAGREGGMLRSKML